jgi:hypothetical protein
LETRRQSITAGAFVIAPICFLRPAFHSKAFVTYFVFLHPHPDLADRQFPGSDLIKQPLESGIEINHLCPP